MLEFVSEHKVDGVGFLPNARNVPVAVNAIAVHISLYLSYMRLSRDDYGLTERERLDMSYHADDEWHNADSICEGKWHYVTPAQRTTVWVRDGFGVVLEEPNTIIGGGLFCIVRWPGDIPAMPAQGVVK